MEAPEYAMFKETLLVALERLDRLEHLPGAIREITRTLEEHDVRIDQLEVGLENVERQVHVLARRSARRDIELEAVKRQLNALLTRQSQPATWAEEPF